MKRFQFRSVILVTLFFLSIVIVSGCGGGDFATPESTIDTAQEALDNNNWEKLYEAFSSDWKDKHISRWRDTVKNLLRESPDSYSVSAEELNQLNSKQIFRTFLESLSRSRRTKQILNQYASVDYEITKRESKTVRVKAKSRLPLPYKWASLRNINGEWKIDEIDR